MPRKFKYPDVAIVVAILALIAVGLVANYSTSFAATGGAELFHFDRQLLWAAVGLGCLLLAMLIPTRVIQSLAYVFYGLGVLLLIIVLFAGKGAGSARWFAIGPVHFQPSELMKAALIIGLARLLADNIKTIARPRVFLGAFAVALVPMGLVIIEPDLGTSIIFPATALCMLAWAGVPASHLILVVMPVVAVITSWSLPLHIAVLIVFLLVLWRQRLRLMPLVSAAGVYLIAGAVTPRLWMQLHEYQRKRILTFLDPEADPLGSAYQIIQSKISIGSGGITGKGFLHGTQTQLKFLPEQHTDFIFSAWGEEFGFLGTLFVVAMFGLIVFRGLRIGARAHNPFNSLLAAGIVCTMAFQALMNLFVAVGWLPVTGLPLPFVSYGGSSLLIYMTMMGLLLGVTMRWREH